jgi:hypothetical protein
MDEFSTSSESRSPPMRPQNPNASTSALRARGRAPMAAPAGAGNVSRARNKYKY